MSEQPCTCEEVEDLDCQCSFADSDCITFSGSGNGTTITANIRLDSDPNNLAEESIDGVNVPLPATIITPPACHVFRNSNTAVPNDRAKVVSFNAVRYDTDLMHDGSRININTSGIYIMTFNAVFEANGEGERHAFIRLNGSEIIAAQGIRPPEFGMDCGLSVAAQEFLCDGDYIQAVVMQDSNLASLNLLSTRSSPNLAVHYRRGIP